MKEPSDLTDLFTKFFEEEHYYQSDHFLSRITHQIKAAPPVQVESVVARVAEPILNRLSLGLIESSVKKLESHILYHVSTVKVYWHLFTSLSKASKRFRGTIRHAHNVHAWYGLLRNSGNQHYINDAVDCLRSVIEELNIAFNDEYIYWKRFVPELMTLYFNVQYQMPHVHVNIRELFTVLLKTDFTFVAQCHYHLGRKETLDMLRIIDDVVNSPGVEIDQCNVSFCADWLKQLKQQQMPAGVMQSELSKINKMKGTLERIVTNGRIHVVQHGELSSDEDDDEEEEDEDEGMEETTGRRKSKHEKDEEEEEGGEADGEGRAEEMDTGADTTGAVTVRKKRREEESPGRDEELEEEGAKHRLNGTV